MRPLHHGRIARALTRLLSLTSSILVATVHGSQCASSRIAAHRRDSGVLVRLIVLSLIYWQISRASLDYDMKSVGLAKLECGVMRLLAQLIGGCRIVIQTDICIAEGYIDVCKESKGIKFPGIQVQVLLLRQRLSK